MSRRMSVVTIVLLLASLFLLPASVGAEGITDAPPTAARYSHRLIVELQSAPLAEWNAASASIAASGETRTALNVNAPAAQQYLQKLQSEQASFVTAMQHAIPNAKVATYLNEDGAAVPATYQVVLNGVAVDAGQNVDVLALREQLQRLPGVQAVYLDFAHDPDMYASLPLINAAAAWNNAAIGGKANAGAGIKFASMDGGVHHAAPMFDGTGYAYPAGFPQGDKRNNNGKIILSKMYFRTWDPPVPADAYPWPVLGTPHGTHTSSTAAGNEVQASYLGSTPVTLSGVAPKAWVMSYRVFYQSIRNDGSFYNVEGIKALEDIAVDGADVLNNSWGGGPTSTGGEFDALDKALINVARAGTFVSMSNGNSGPNLATGDHPSPDYINVAASTTTGTFGAGRFNVTAPEPTPANLQGISFAVAGFGATIPVGTVLGPYNYLPAAVANPANALGCNAWPTDTFAGKAAVISRGTCEFGVKALYAQQAGAVFVVIYNSAAGGDALLNMGAGTVGSQVTIPVIAVGRTNGLAIDEWYKANPATAQFALDTKAFQIGNTPDIIADFSSRGPGVGNVLKPDIAAPGVNILAQGYGPGTGEARMFGFGEASGTSMASPHVAGAAALLRQIHPTWGNAWIKSALMSTSKYMDIYVNSARTIPAQPLDMGAGRLDLTNAADPGVILNPPSLSFGQMYTSTTKTIEVQVTSVAAAAETYAVSTLYTGMGYASTTPVAGMTVDSASLTLAPGETKTLKVTWSTAASMGYGDNQGFVILTGSSHNAHMPAWMRVALVPTAVTTPPYGKILVIDADGSTNLGMPDYTPYYTDALTHLGLPSVVWDADAHAGGAATIPDAVTLAQYSGIILQTGDNFCPSTGTSATCKGTNRPLTTLDMDRLLEYANNGGHIVSFGQDLASVTGSAVYPATGNDHSFYSFLLNGGEGYLQDSVNAEKVFTDTAQLLTGYPGGYSPVSWMSFDVSARGDGAGNQYYMDEIALIFGKYGCDSAGWDSPDKDLCLDQYQPWLKYAPGGPQIMSEGIVAMSHRDQPTLERPGVSFKGTSVYFSFGLEGVNNNTGYYGREQLLASAVTWSVDAVSVVVTPTAVAPVGQVSYFQARLTSSVLMPAWNYRWDFGDGTEFTNIYPSVVGHTYAQPGTYTVRVQGTDAYGTRGLGSTTVTVPQVYDVPETQTFPAAQDSFIDGGLPNSNYGGWGQLFVRSDDLVRSLYQFDLSSVNPLYPVTKATLYLWVDAFSGGGSPAELHAFELTTPWNESTVTWKTPWSLAGGDFTGAAAGTTPIVKEDVGTWKQIDVTALAQKWVADPAANKGVVIRLRNFTSFTGYRLTSSEYWVPANLPKLEVTYLKP